MEEEDNIVECAAGSAEAAMDGNREEITKEVEGTKELELLSGRLQQGRRD